MDMPELTKRHEWIVHADTFSLMVSAHRQCEDWVWCVYVLVSAKHPLFINPEAVCELPFHGGCTYAEKFTQEPARGMRYEWQRTMSYLKIGCDYHHIDDDRYAVMDPADGVPRSIKSDMEALFAEMSERAGKVSE